jgi:hypothetical protein
MILRVFSKRFFKFSTASGTSLPAETFVGTPPSTAIPSPIFQQVYFLLY